MANERKKPEQDPAEGAPDIIDRELEDEARKHPKDERPGKPQREERPGSAS